MPQNPVQKFKLENKPAPKDRTSKRSWLQSKLHFRLFERNRDQSTPLPALTFSKERANYYNNLSLETRKTYGYPLPAKPPEFKIPRKPLKRYEYCLDENPKVEIGKRPKLVRPQIIDIPQQANSPKPNLRAKKSSSQSSTHSRPPRTPSKMNMEELKREYSDFEHFRPREEYQKLQQTVKETKYARPTVTASEVQRYKSSAGVIDHESSRRSSVQFSESSHSRPGSSRMLPPVEQFQIQQGLSFEMLSNQYELLEAQDRRIEEPHRPSTKSLRSEARSRKSREVTTPQSPREIQQVEARPLPPIPPPHQSPAKSLRSEARSHISRTETTPQPPGRIGQIETRPLLPILPPHQSPAKSRKSREVTNSQPPRETHQIKARPLPPIPPPDQSPAISVRSSAKSHRSENPTIHKPSENLGHLETRFPPRIPITRSPHQPTAIPIHPSARLPSRILITGSSHQPTTMPKKSSARPYRPITRPSENNKLLETGFLERFPISHQPPLPISYQPPAIPHQPSARSHRPQTPLIPKPLEKTILFEARSSRPPPNTLKKRRRRPPVPSSGKEKEKKRRWWKI